MWHAKVAGLAEINDDFPTASRHWKTAVHLMPANSGYAKALGKTYAQMGRYEEAVEAFDRAARLNAEDMEGWIDLAEAAKTAGMLSEAMEAAQRASQVGLDDIRGLLLTSEVAREMGDTATATEYARLALRRDPNNPNVVLALGKALTQEGLEEQSLNIIEEKLPELPAWLPLLYERARLVYKIKGAPAASGILAKLAQMYPDDSEVLAMMARVQVDSGDPKGAERSAVKSLRLNPNQPVLSLMLGRIERESGQLDQAVYFLTEAIRMQPTQIEAYLELGQTYINRREHGSALEVYRQAIRAVPKDKRGYYAAAMIFKDSKDTMSAESMLQQAAKLDPEDLQIRRQLIAVMALNLIHKSQEANTAV